MSFTSQRYMSDKKLNSFKFLMLTYLFVSEHNTISTMSRNFARGIPDCQKLGHAVNHPFPKFPDLPRMASQNNVDTPTQNAHQDDTMNLLVMNTQYINSHHTYLLNYIHTCTQTHTQSHPHIISGIPIHAVRFHTHTHTHSVFTHHTRNTATAASLNYSDNLWH